MRCGWCSSDAGSGATNCARCGGPLGSPIDAGPPPPAAPRALPALFVRRALFTANEGMWFAVVWIGITGIFPLIFGVLSCTNPVMLPAALMCLVFPAPGAFVGWLSYRKARRRVAVLRDGRAATGTLDAVGPDPSTSTDGEHPWLLRYVFEVDGRRWGGARSTFDPGVRALPVGAPVHVVYLPSDPEQNDIWPLVPR
jgi:hypothetical protein